MKELINLTLRFDLKKLLIEPTGNVAVQAFRSLFVGGVAFVSDAGVLWLLSSYGIYYLVGAVFGFIAGVTVNYLLSVKFVFKEKAVIGKSGEIAVYFIVSIIGLALTLGLMWLFTEVAGLFYMLSKIAATVLVFAWNFTARKVILYGKTRSVL